MLAIVDSYNLSEEDRQLVLAQIAAWRPDIDLTASATA